MHNLINLPFFCIRAKWVLNAVYFLQNAFCFLFSVAYLSSAATSTKRFGLFNPPSLLREHLLTRPYLSLHSLCPFIFPIFPRLRHISLFFVALRSLFLLLLSLMGFVPSI